jgi:hypothetical protein
MPPKSEKTHVGVAGAQLCSRYATLLMVLSPQVPILLLSPAKLCITTNIKGFRPGQEKVIRWLGD